MSEIRPSDDIAQAATYLAHFATYADPRDVARAAAHIAERLKPTNVTTEYIYCAAHDLALMTRRPWGTPAAVAEFAAYIAHLATLAALDQPYEGELRPLATVIATDSM